MSRGLRAAKVPSGHCSGLFLTANLRKVRQAGSESVVLNAPSSAACLSNLLQICSKVHNAAVNTVLHGSLIFQQCLDRLRLVTGLPAAAGGRHP